MDFTTIKKVTGSSFNKPRFFSKQGSGAERNETLDVIRGVAVMLVILHHIVIIQKPAHSNIFLTVIRSFFSPFVRGGWIGVDLFFVLSGFLVSGLLFKEYKKIQRVNAFRFLVRRGFKIYPSFIFFICAAFLLERAFYSLNNIPFIPTSYYLKDLFFLYNYFGGRFIHTWSLDVEEHFYFLLAAFFSLFITKTRLNFKLFLTTYLVLTAVCIAGRIAADGYQAFIYTHTRLDALFCGVLISYIYHCEPSRFNFIKKNKGYFILTAILLILPNFLINREKNPFTVISLSTNPICLGVLLIILLETRHYLSNNFILSFIGRHSYNIYLWHVFVNMYVLKFFFSADITTFSLDTSLSFWLVYVLIYSTLSIFIGVLFTKIVEVPFLRFRDKFYPSINKTAIIK